MRYLIQIVRVLIPLLVGWVLCQAMGLWPAIGIALASAICLPIIGALLLRTVTTDAITWRNQVAGWLLPWGYKIGRGKLPAITIISGVVWALLFTLGTIAGRPMVVVEASPVSTSSPSSLLNFLLVLSWAVDGAVLFYFAGMLSRDTDFSRRPGSTMAKLAAIVGLLIVVSFIFWLTGKPSRALWISGLPPLACGLLFGAWCILLVTVGKNARWN